MNNNKQIMKVLLLVVASCSLVSSLASAQFLPQSHLGRLVQSIASPLVLSSGAYSDEGDSSSSPVSGDPPSTRYNPYEQAGEQQTQQQPQKSYHTNQQHGSGLVQAPSQQRGVPQQYYYGGRGRNANQDPDSDQVSVQPSNSKQTQQDYQMGAYLGPTMDDKELNGVFNSNNDERDDDESSGYEGDASGQHHRPSSVSGHNYGQSGLENSQGSGYERQPSYRSQQQRPSSAAAYDDDGADEDEPVPTRRRPSYRGSSALSRAASQYRQQGAASGAQYSKRYNNNPNQQQQLIAAANGYAPYGYSAGPVDLTGLMAGMGGDPNSNLQVYNGDGSYPGANYNQQGAQRGRSQAASMNNGYYNNQQGGSGYGPNGYNQGSGNRAGRSDNDNDDNDNDADED